jgi:exodeoxyribonuclease V alpha subunit
MRDAIDYGYALTVHKFQGSQAKHVIAVIPANSDFLFGKPLLYTAISRAQISLAIIGDIDVIPRIAAREGVTRETALQLMFKA